MTVAPGFGGSSIVTLGPEVIGAPQSDRRAVVVLGEPLAPPNGKPRKPATERIVQTLNGAANDLRIKFSVKKPAAEPLAISTLKAWGLSEETRNRFDGRRRFPLRLIAGYGTRLYTVCNLVIAQCYSEQDAAGEMVTTFQGFHGDPAALGSQKRLGWGPGTGASDVAAQIGGLLGQLGAGSLRTIKEAGAGKRLPFGYQTHKSMSDEMDQIMAQLECDWCLCDDELLVTRKGQTTQELYVVSPESGLILSPVPSSPPAPSNIPRLRARCLMNPTFRPMSKLLLRSASHRGPFQCWDVGLDGDTWGGDWFTTMEMNYLPGSK